MLQLASLLGGFFPVPVHSLIRVSDVNSLYTKGRYSGGLEWELVNHCQNSLLN